MLRFFRIRRSWGALLLGYLVLAASAFIGWQGMVPVPPPFFVLITCAVGFVSLLPYLVDRFISHRLHGFAATLVLPVAWVTVEYVDLSLNPVGQWNTIAYSQARNLALLQLVSVTGIWGITFLLAWFAATVNWAWEHGFDWKKIRRGIAIYVGVLSAVLLFGQARMTLFAPSSATVRVAGVTANPEGANRSFFAMATDDSDGSLQNNRGRVLNVQNMLFDLSSREARAGARIIVWSEANAFVHADHEEALIKRGQKFAREEEVILLMSLYTMHPGEHSPENKALMIDSQGSVRSVYHKTMVAVEASLPGDGVMPMWETPYGKITSAICVDYSHPGFIRQAGRADADIALDPSWDWKPIDPFHTWVSATRAVENGFSLFRQTNDGLSAAVDYQGRVLATMDHFTTHERVMVSEVPTKGVTTVYSRIGNLFAWFCVAALAVFLGKELRRRGD